MKRLSNKTALITGCNRGIGRAIMEAFMAEGCSIVACTRRLTPELQDYYAAKEAEYGVRIRPLCFDLESEESIRHAMRELYGMRPVIDTLVNNAGIVNTDGLMRIKMDEVRRVMQVNFFAPVMITQYVVKLMMKSANPSIINMASVAAFTPTVGNTVYGASKAALISATKCWAKELGTARIRVNAIAPGYIDTEMTDSINKDVIDNLVGDTALKRLGTTEEIARGAVYLASDEASYVDGHVLVIGGGIGFD